MKKRTAIGTIAVLMATIAIILCGGAQRASAQQNTNCCVYYVDVANFPPGCFPANLWSNWSSGVAGPVMINGNATFPFPFVFPAPQPCPLAPTFMGVSFAGPNGPWATFNNPVQFTVGRCCFIARLSFDQFGCVYVTVRPC